MTIKYRGWDKNGRKIHIGFIDLVNNEAYGLGYDIQEAEEMTVVSLDSLEQWTGLCDKNNVEIYVGDLLKDEYGNIGPCYYEPSNFVFINTSGCVDDGSKWEIVGTIHKEIES